MIPVKTKPRFKCDFCKKRLTEKAMRRHEGHCYYNPNRVCNRCEDGIISTTQFNIDGKEVGEETRECEYCVIAEEIKKIKNEKLSN